MEIVETRRVDDIDQKSPAPHTIKFSFDGRHYTIDLTDKNKAKFAEAMAPWIEAARTTPPPGKRGRVTRASNAEVRAWLKAHGHDVPDRGRISNNYLALYDNAH